MSVGTKLLQAAAGNVGGAVYVDDVFSTFLWTGDSSGSRSINNGIDLDGEGGLVWIKGRTSAYDHALYDTARGVTKEIYSNKADAQQTNSNTLTSFNSNGFSIGDDTLVNNNNEDYVSWSFRKAEKFFDIVTYSGNATNGRAINHNLGSTPGMIIVKSKTSSTYWAVYHRSLGEGHYLYLNTTDAKSVYDSNSSNSRYWNNTAPTSTQFTVSNDGWVNGSGQDYVAYLFAHNEADYGENSDEAIIYCDSFTNDSSSVGVEVNVGFEPQWLFIKGASSGSGLGSWQIIDSMRNAHLKPNSNAAESSTVNFDFTPRGFTPTTYYDGTLIYVAIRRPNKPATEFAATDLFTVDEADNTDGKEPKFRTTFPVDFAIDNWAIQNGSDKHVSSRLISGKYLRANSTTTESSESGYQFDYMNGFKASSGATSGMYAWMFRRAKGFFDVVTYNGTGSDRTQTHNLGVAPELILIKRRGPSNADWVWYVGPLGAGKYMYGDSGAELSSTTIWSNTAPTASVFSLGNQGGGGTYRINGSGSTYIAYLWATVAGISKIGSYTGTGSDLNVDCGFSAGARFILIKRTDGSGDWYIYDSVRGIVAGDDPYTLLNTTAVQVTNTDFIDPLSAGFTVTAAAGASVSPGFNTSGGAYIFLAIA